MTSKPIIFSGESVMSETITPAIKTTPATITNIAKGEIIPLMNAALRNCVALVQDQETYPIGSKFTIETKIVLMMHEDQQSVLIGATARIKTPEMRPIGARGFIGPRGQLVIPFEDFDSDDKDD